MKRFLLFTITLLLFLNTVNAQFIEESEAHSNITTTFCDNIKCSESETINKNNTNHHDNFDYFHKVCTLPILFSEKNKCELKMVDEHSINTFRCGKFKIQGDCNGGVISVEEPLLYNPTFNYFLAFLIIIEILIIFELLIRFQKSFKIVR